MKDNSSQEGQTADTTVKDEDSKVTAKDAVLPRKGVTPKPRSSGKGLYITAIVLGIIIVILLALYIYLSITHRSVAHTYIAPLTAINMDFKRLDFHG
jgi:hypothetical protein